MPTASISTTTKEYIRSAINNTCRKPENGNILIMGIATSGPVNTPVKLNTIEEANAIFNKNIVEVYTVVSNATTIELTYIPESLVSIEAYNESKLIYEPSTTIKDISISDNVLTFTGVAAGIKVKISYRVAYDRYCIMPKLEYLFENGISPVTAMRITGEHAVTEIPSVAYMLDETNTPVALIIEATNTAMSNTIISTTSVPIENIGMRIYKNDETFSISATITDISENGLEIEFDTVITDANETAVEWVIGYPIILTVADAGVIDIDSTDKHYVAFRLLMRNRLALTLHSPTWSEFSDTLIYLDEHTTLGSIVTAINKRYFDKQSEFVAYTPDPFAAINFQQYLYYLTDGNYGVTDSTTFGCDLLTWYDNLDEGLNYVRLADYNAVDFTVYNDEMIPN